jgi:hypothetical protein
MPERHRHRYEVNTHYRGRLEQHGMRFCGMSPDGLLPEMIEYDDHPWFVGVQFHPELKSRPFEPHPLFASRRRWSRAGWCRRRAGFLSLLTRLNVRFVPGGRPQRGRYDVSTRRQDRTFAL